jgi:hypothetical protein
MAQMGRRFWIELALGASSAFLFAITLIWRDWIEMAFGVDPDHGTGALEWVIVTLTATVAVASFVLARIEWRRAQLEAG